MATYDAKRLRQMRKDGRLPQRPAGEPSRSDLLDVCLMATDLTACADLACLHIECNVKRAAARVLGR